MVRRGGAIGWRAAAVIGASPVDSYRVRVVSPGGWTQTAANPPDIRITRGRVVDRINFGFASATWSNPTGGMIAGTTSGWTNTDPWRMWNDNHYFTRRPDAGGVL